MSAVNEATEQYKEGLNQQADCLGRLNDQLETEHDRIVYTHRLADEGEYTTRDGTHVVGELGERVKALEQLVAEL